MTLRFLVCECEPRDARDARRDSVGASAGESFAALLARMVPGVVVAQATPADADAPPPLVAALAAYDGVFLTGSPLHVYHPTPAVERELAFMRAVFASGTPAFGSCAGLQVAVAAAGGTVRAMQNRREAGIARRIWLTPDGRDHPLLRGRPPAYDALAVHGDEVERLPAGATLLAGNAATAIQAAEIRHDGGIFWGVQYHPELSLGEVAAALRRDTDTLIAEGLARTRDEVDAHAALIEAVGEEPDRADLAWRLGVGREILIEEMRHAEIRNFIDHLVRPVQAARAARG